MESRKPSPAADAPCRLVYDAECRLCIEAKQRLERAGLQRVESVRFVPYQSDEARQALGVRYRPGRPDVAFFVKPSGAIDEGLKAFLPLVPYLRRGRAIQRLLAFPLMLTVAQSVYSLIARHRYRLFGRVSSTAPR